MSLESLKDSLPDYAKDLKLNLSNLARATVLDDQQKWGTFLASAHAVGDAETLKAIAAETGMTRESLGAMTQKMMDAEPAVREICGSSLFD